MVKAGRSKASRTKYYARYRTRGAAGAGAMVVSRPLRSVSWKGGFVINRMGVSWCFNNATSGATLQASAGPGFAGTSAVNVGPPTAIPGTTGSLMYNVPWSMDFTLDSLEQFVDLQNISDKYMIYKVEVSFWTPATSSLGANLTGTPTETLPSIPYLHYCQDNDDNAAPQVQAFKSRMGIRGGQLGQGRRIVATVYPRVAPIVQSAGGATFSVPSKPIFINTANANVQHYGLKGYFANVTLSGVGDTNGATVIMAETKYFIKVRDLQ